MYEHDTTLTHWPCVERHQSTEEMGAQGGSLNPMTRYLTSMMKRVMAYRAAQCCIGVILLCELEVRCLLDIIMSRVALRETVSTCRCALTTSFASMQSARDRLAIDTKCKSVRDNPKRY